MKSSTDKNMKELIKKADEAKSNGKPLGGVFEEFAKKTGGAKGSVRNAYYAAIKRANTDKEYSEAVFGGIKPKVAKIIEFDKAEAKIMLKKILIKVTEGRSVRSSIGLIASDPKQALRYQNKYRNMLAFDKPTVIETVNEIKRETGECYDPYGRADEPMLKRLKAEINALYDRIAENLRKENEALKRENAELKREISSLKSADNKASLSKDYFENVDARPNRKA
ncbi:unknown [Acidiphilium sp. CAG:727]|nr:unknown [Acidiphilium sp. CAG:727]